MPDPAPTAVWWHDVTDPALVLGSSQRDDAVDLEACERSGVEVVRRRSGGGAVLLVPGEVTWLDVIVPAGAPGWSEDVHGPMVWLGEHLVEAFEASGHVGEFEVHRGAMRTTRWSSTLCFDGIGAGEVLLDGTKLVGISQRRTRSAARLQCCWYSTYEPERLVELLVESSRPPLVDLGDVATVAPSVADAIPRILVDLLA